MQTLLKIGDFSHLAQVTVRTLRLYDEMDLLKPAQVDHFTGYRYYSIEQLPRLNRILALKEMGLSLEQINQLMRQELSPEELRGMLTLKRVEIAERLAEEQTRLARVEARLQLLEGQADQFTSDVLIKRLPAVTIAAAGATMPRAQDMDQYCTWLYEALYGWLEANEIDGWGTETTFYHNTEYTEENINMQAAVILEGEVPHPDDLSAHERAGIHHLPAVEMAACVTRHGPLNSVTPVIIGLFGWAVTNGYTFSPPLREVHHAVRIHSLPDAGGTPIVYELQIPLNKPQN